MKKEKESYKTDCRLFGGYKPCRPFKVCKGCKDYSPAGKRILIINLDALGDVLKTTALLAPIKRKYKDSNIIWLTGQNAHPLLANNPYIDKIYPYNLDSVLSLSRQEFDILLNADKTQHASALANAIKAKKKFGFQLSETGVIVPANKEAAELYRMGLDDELKFFKNTKSNQCMLAGAWALDYKRDEYVLNLSNDEKEFAADFRKKNRIDGKDFVIGVNTGSSVTYPYKRLPAETMITGIKRVNRLIPDARIALLGGKEDAERNRLIKDAVKDLVIETPCDMGLRMGILFLEACDMVVTGDTLALHIAIALKKPVVAWFTTSCENEIDLYDRGVKVVSKTDCRPCWKSSCDKKIKCNEKVDIDELAAAVLAVYKQNAKK